VSQPSYPYAPAAPGFTAYGFGGWNLDNVDIILNGTSSFFDETDGSYYFDTDSDLTYLGEVDNGAGTVTGYVLAKDWPVGEPSGQDRQRRPGGQGPQTYQLHHGHVLS
jgi:hypothetical protein